MLLPPVLAADADRTWSYLGWLTSALAHTERARLDAAAEAYERAATLLPGCPTAMLGLSAIRRLQGRLLDSAAAAEALVAGGTRCDDPWSFYRFGEWPDVRARRLLGLRRMVTGP